MKFIYSSKLYSRAGRLGLLCCFVLPVLLSGCMQQSAGQQRPEASAPAAPAAQPFAVAVSALHPGEQVLMSSPYGDDSLVLVEGSYTSGLGDTCRRTVVNYGGAVHRLAVCQGASGWYVAKPVFDNLPR